MRHYPPPFTYLCPYQKENIGVAVDVMISCWLLYASLEMNEEERGVKLLNNLILVPFFCIINLSLYCTAVVMAAEREVNVEIKTLKGHVYVRDEWEDISTQRNYNRSFEVRRWRYCNGTKNPFFLFLHPQILKLYNGSHKDKENFSQNSGQTISFTVGHKFLYRLTFLLPVCLLLPVSKSQSHWPFDSFRSNLCIN